MGDLSYYAGDTTDVSEVRYYRDVVESLDISPRLREVLRLPPNKRAMFCQKIPEGTGDGCAVFDDDLSSSSIDIYWTDGLFGCYGMSLIGFNYPSRTWRFIFAHNRGWDTEASWTSKSRLNGRIAAFCERLDRIHIEGCQSMLNTGSAAQAFNERMSITESRVYDSTEYTYFPRLGFGFQGRPKDALIHLESYSTKEVIDNALLSVARLEPPIYRALYNKAPEVTAARELITKNPTLKDGLSELRERKKNEASRGLFGRSLSDLSGQRKQQKIDFLDAIHEALERGDLHAMESAFDILGDHTDESHDTNQFATQLRGKVLSAKADLAVADAQAHAVIRAEHMRLARFTRPLQRHCTFLYEGLRTFFTA